MKYGDIAEVLRFTADALMVGSRTIIIKKVKETRSVSGLSLQTQLIYFVAYIFRYLDLLDFSGRFTNKRIYNTVMKILFISYQAYLIYLILFPFKNTYNKRFDNFNLPVIFVVSFAISFFIKGETSSVSSYFDEYFYTCSLVLEAVAILPQLVMIQEAGDCEALTSLYILLLGLYRFFYVMYFIFNYLSGKRLDLLVIITGLVQTGLYLDFFIVYYVHVLKNMNFLKLRAGA